MEDSDKAIWETVNDRKLFAIRALVGKRRGKLMCEYLLRLTGDLDTVDATIYWLSENLICPRTERLLGEFEYHLVEGLITLDKEGAVNDMEGYLGRFYFANSDLRLPPQLQTTTQQEQLLYESAEIKRKTKRGKRKGRSELNVQSLSSNTMMASSAGGASQGGGG